MLGNPMPSWFRFLRVETDLAMTFIGIAQIRLRPEDSARSLENARKALAQIQHCLMDPTHYGLKGKEILFLEQRCVEIKSAFRVFERSSEVW